MKLTPLIKRTVLIALALTLEAIDKHITESLQKPIEAPKEPDPSKCICEGINQPTDKTNAFLYCSKHNRTYLNNQYVNEDMPVYRKPPLTLEQIKDKYRTARIDTFNSSLPIRHYYNHNTGIITSTTATSKYTPEQLQSFYKINPYTNKPTNPPKKR